MVQITGAATNSRWPGNGIHTQSNVFVTNKEHVDAAPGVFTAIYNSLSEAFQQDFLKMIAIARNSDTIGSKCETHCVTGYAGRVNLVTTGQQRLFATGISILSAFCDFLFNSLIFIWIN